MIDSFAPDDHRPLRLGMVRRDHAQSEVLQGASTMKTIALVLATLTATCATAAPEHRLGTEGISADQLAVVSVASDQVKIVDTDGTPVPWRGTSDFYLKPGAHKLLIELHWCPGGNCMSFGSFAEAPRTACFDAKAGATYRFTAGNLGPDWVPQVTEKVTDADAKKIDPRCP
jgi:hypothetical protein